MIVSLVVCFSLLLSPFLLASSSLLFHSIQSYLWPVFTVRIKLGISHRLHQLLNNKQAPFINNLRLRSTPPQASFAVAVVAAAVAAASSSSFLKCATTFSANRSSATDALTLGTSNLRPRRMSQIRERGMICPPAGDADEEEEEDGSAESGTVWNCGKARWCCSQ